MVESTLMDPARLRLLRELRDRGSITAVAAANHVSASAVSQQLSALQAGVPVPLTRKRGRNLVLTEAGEALADAGVRVDEALAGARDAVAGFLATRDRTVTVSAFHSAGLVLFGPLLAELGGDPSTGLRDADVAHADFPGLTADHDLVVAHRLPNDPEWPAARVQVRPLFVEPLDVALHPAHPLAARREIDLEQLRDQRWISVHEGFPLAGVLQHLGALLGAPPRIEHRINELSVTARVIGAGGGAAIMPRYTAASFSADEIVLRPIRGVRLVRHVDVLARPDVLARSSVRAVLGALERVAAAAGGAAARNR